MFAFLYRFLIVLSVFGSSLALSEDGVLPVRLYNSDSYPLNLNMSVLTDAENRLTIEQISSKDHQQNFVVNRQKILNLGIGPSAYWLKFQLEYPDSYPNTQKTKKLYLEIAKSLLDTAELYSLRPDGSFSMQASDLSRDFSKREILHVNSVFPIEISLGEEKTYYLKIHNRATSIQVALYVWSPPAFVEKVAGEEFIYGVFYGSMLVLLLYNLFVYISTKDLTYLYYVMYLAPVTLFQLIETGHGTIHLGWFLTVIGKEWLASIIWVAFYFGILFFKYFLNLKKEHPFIHKTYTVCGQIVLISLAISLFRRDHVSILWVTSFALFFLIYAMVVSLYSWRKGNENAKYFFFAWTLNIVGLLTYALMINEVLPATAFTIASAPMGIILEALLLSFALANRIKRETSWTLNAERKAMRHMSRFQSIFDNSLEGMYQIDLNGHTRGVNHSMATIMGYNKKSELLKHKNVIANALFDTEEGRFGRILEDGYLNADVEFSIKKSKPLWLSHRAKMVFDDYGNARYIEGTVIDMTEEKERESAIRAGMKERLNKELAISSTKEKGQFLSIMNHQIRTPLNAIIGCSEILHEKSYSKADKNFYIDTIVNNARSLLSLINNILDYSKLEAKKFDIEKIDVDLEEIFNEIHKYYIDVSSEKRVAFDISYTGEIPAVIKGDPTRIAQVVRNLCDNAFSNTDTGSVKIELSWENDKLKIMVSDTGRGIKKDLLDNIFYIKYAPENSGLGITISRNLVDLMGGEISATSIVGKGSSFVFTISAKAKKDSALIDIKTMKNSGVDEYLEFLENKPPSNKDKQNKKYVPIIRGIVYLAEDNIVNQKLITKVIQKTGATVIVANDGVEICNLCDIYLPDLVLMDINMPNMDGLSATKYLREKHYQIPIHALTAEVDKDEIDKALEAGCDGVLSKPLNKQNLYQVLEENIKSSSKLATGRDEV
ncbi:MAG: hypothetical protein COA99_14820 [Moraxellaceae bacterium]|nr:MAG: hypothetical protein COA99_14820 [Moraxellaceae bacterium]